MILSFGDITVGSKIARPLAPGLSAGGEVGLRFLSSASTIGYALDATSVWFGGLATYDLVEAVGAPLRFHLNAGYMIDNSSRLQESSSTGLGSRVVTSFAYGVAKDRARLAVGVDAPLAVGRQVSLMPLAEYHLDVVTADADPATPGVGPLNNRDQHSVTVGLRARLAGGLTMDAGVDVGLRSLGFRHGSTMSPYNVVVGLAYPLDLVALGGPRVVTRTVVIEKVVPVEKAPPPREGFVVGKITSSRGGMPVAGALVSVSGKEGSRIATEADGTFSSKGLPPGDVDLEISAPNFESALVPASVVLGKLTAISASLTPRVQKGRIEGRLVDDRGGGVEGVIKFSGPEAVDARTDASGNFSVALDPGSYRARVDGTTFLKKERQLGIAEGEAKPLQLEVRRRPATPAALVRGSEVTSRIPVRFLGADAGGPSSIAPHSLPILDEVADLMLTHSEIRRLRVEAHWDSGLGSRADTLTDEQARAVTRYLVSQGIDEGRLEPVGMGARHPLVPNLGRAYRLKNRRIEFHLQ
jgi:outer membrane protein OmpA-like peptidoglycan-associated protein